MKKYECLFFDLDRTLWDFDTNSYTVLDNLFQKYGLEGYVKTLKRFIKLYEKENYRLWKLYRDGKATREQVSYLRFSRTLKAIGAPEKWGQEMGEAYFEQMNQQSLLLPDAETVVKELKSRYKLAIITNGFVEIQDTKMHVSGLDKYFDHVITSEDIHVPKPRPAIFEFALKTMGVTPEAALMIGDDHRTDILGAKRAGIDQVWLDPHNKNKRGDATYKINALTDLLTKIRL